MKKRILSLLLCAAMLLTLLPQTVLFASADDSGTCGTNLSWSYNSSTYTLTITGTGAMKNWSYDSDVPWYSYRSSIKSVSLPDGLTSIGSEAFYGCTGLTGITIPSGVTSIGDSAFYGCTGLTSITVAEGNPVYDSRNNCNAIIETATNTLIAGCKNTVIPDSVTSIGDYAFCDCTGLTAITIPDSVTSIGDYAFYGCTGLTAISIPDGVTSIGDYAFVGCTGLTSITVAEGNPVYDSRNNCNAIIETATNTLIAGCKNTVIPDSVTSIGDSAFAGCTGLTGITIPSGVTAISDGAFADCTGLTAISIPDSVTSIGWGAFYGCTGLTAIAIPDSVTSIGEQAFNGCTGLTSITVAEGNPVYDSRNNCNAIIETATNTLIAGCKNTVIPSGVTAISDGAFADCTGLTAISIPDSVTSIGWGAFYGCTGLTAITIGNGVTSIDYYAFYDCTGLTSITVAEGNPVYDSRNNCNAIIETATNTLIAGCKNTVIPDSVTSIGDCAFVHCTGLTNITIPSAVTSICDEAFYGCSSLTSVTIPDSVTSIGAWAFYGCSSLTSVTIGNSVTSIGEDAFYGCSSLTSVYFCGDAPELDVHVFVLWDELKEENIAIPGLTLYYIEGKTGWTTPTWNGYPTATWKPESEDKPTTTFTDVKTSDWFYKAVNFAVSNSLFNGMGDNKFEPDTAMNRAMLVTVLWRYAGSPKEGTNTFTDVESGQWYTDAVAWASSNSIVGGVGEGRFDPNGNVTREQLAAILYRYSSFKGIDTGKRGDLSAFPDEARVSAWATAAYSWAVGEGLIGGNNINGQTLLDPQGNATRAQVATILMRFIQNIAEK